MVQLLSVIAIVISIIALFKDCNSAPHTAEPKKIDEISAEKE